MLRHKVDTSSIQLLQDTLINSQACFRYFFFFIRVIFIFVLA